MSEYWKDKITDILGRAAGNLWGNFGAKRHPLLPVITRYSVFAERWNEAQSLVRKGVQRWCKKYSLTMGV